MKRSLILVASLAVALLATSFAPATARAAVPCRDRIYNDWYHDGRIASSYPTSCYRDALKHVPADARIYSSLSTDIKSAMLASLRRQAGKSAPKQVGRGLNLDGGGQLVSAHDPKPTTPARNAAGSSNAPVGATSSAPVADTTSSGVPLPILVLGGLALALAAAGAVGTGVRYARRRG